MSPLLEKPTLTYFDMPVSRGEECRIALRLAGVEFIDERLNREQWEARKAAAPFGALPILTIPGREPLAQSHAILSLIGRQHGLLPSDAWESARHEAVMISVEDLRAKLGPTNRMKDPAEKKAARELLAAGAFPDWATQVERQIEGPFLGGATCSVADVKLFVFLTPISNGKIDHLPFEVFSPFPKLLALFEAMKAVVTAGR